MTTVSEQTHSFVDFPAEDAILAKLRAMDAYAPELEDLVGHVAERLASKTYDRSAFVFILIELVYELEDTVGADCSHLLTQAVLALTGDDELASSASDAFHEIKEAIDPEEGAADPAPEAPSDEPALPETLDQDLQEIFGGLGAWPPGKAGDRRGLMAQLQQAQKEMADLGLGTRLSIEMALSRPNRDNVGRTLREIQSLRTVLRTFEELLTRSEERILEAAGVLESDPGALAGGPSKK